MNEITAKTPELSGKPSNRDFFHVLFLAVTGDSGLIVAGGIWAGEELLEHLIDIAELERRTAIKQATLRKYVVQRKVPFVKIGRLVRFDLPEIEAWVKERKVPVLKKEGVGQNTPDNGQLIFQETPEIVHFDRFFPAN